MKIWLLSILAILLAATSNALGKNFFQQIADPVVKPVTKATTWVGKQSGITPTVDNANSAAKSAEQAANDAHKAIVELEPKAGDALGSVKNTSDAAGEILRWVKWPVVASAYICAFWLLSAAVRSWFPRPAESGSVSTSSSSAPVAPRQASLKRLSPAKRFFLVSIGSILFFTLIDGLLLMAGISFQNIVPLLIVSLSVTAIAALVLFWIPFRRSKVCLALGFVAPIAILYAVAFAFP